jgi:hypothetical protein
VRRGSVLVTLRAADGGVQYRNDIDALALAFTLRQEVERVTAANPLGGPTDFTYLGSQPVADAPDDLAAEPPVRQAQVEVRYGWLRA